MLELIRVLIEKWFPHFHNIVFSPCPDCNSYERWEDLYLPSCCVTRCYKCGYAFWYGEHYFKKWIGLIREAL